jgi:hypothetical protein
MLSSQEVIVIVIGTCVFFFGIFYFRRFSGIKSDTRLYLRQKRQVTDAYAGRVLDEATLAESDDIGRTKTLNVLFMYNGHSFDAHEILGIPAGASLKIVDEAYAKLIRTVKPDSREFVEAAYRVLRTELKKRESEN